METVTLTAQPRQGRGKRAAAQLRKQGLVPAIVYGHKEEPAAVTLPQADIERVLRHHVRVVDLQTGSHTDTALIREVQYDHLGKEVLHVDFERHSKDERIHVEVPIELRGTPTGVGSGVVVDQPLHSLKVECPVIAVPESIRVRIEGLQLGHAIHVKELQLPEGVTALADPDAVVVQLKAALPEPEAVVAEPGAAAAAAEPEIVGRRVAKEEGEE
jgi:large subunit ribosomal protein L25